MAKKTLNLTINESIKERAKRIAKSRGISVSQLFEEVVIGEEDPEELPPMTASLSGILKTKTDESDYKKHLEKKHLS